MALTSSSFPGGRSPGLGTRCYSQEPGLSPALCPEHSPRWALAAVASRLRLPGTLPAGPYRNSWNRQTSNKETPILLISF